ncbi:hypothetical protein [Thermococcus sp. JdF3]|uniref:hypothetical protein n=1 Tax=Thermococcus sp. JdF3 TaxID=1638258 RepID=UPI001F101FD2|nr:hypothetical protein [Thermococcus sp. JdF3]
MDKQTVKKAGREFNISSKELCTYLTAETHEDDKIHPLGHLRYAGCFLMGSEKGFCSQSGGLKMRIETSRDNVKSCLEIAKELPEWFNEAGLRAMGRDLREEKTFVAVEGEEVLGFVTVKPLNEKPLKSSGWPLGGS